MKNKELTRLAKEIAQLEDVIERNEDQDAVYQAKNKIIKLSNKLDPEDMLRIDELI